MVDLSITFLGDALARTLGCIEQETSKSLETMFTARSEHNNDDEEENGLSQRSVKLTESPHSEIVKNNPDRLEGVAVE